MENTLERIFSFADAFRTYTATILNSETAQLQSIEPSATACNLVFDRLVKLSQAVDGIPMEDKIEDLHVVRKELCTCNKHSYNNIILVVGKLIVYQSMFHWMHTVNQLAASSKLDLKNYYEHIIKVVMRQRDPMHRPILQ